MTHSFPTRRSSELEQIAFKEVPGDREPGEDVRPIGRTARSQEWRQGKEPIGITRPGRATDGGAAFGADEGEIGGRARRRASIEREPEAEFGEQRSEEHTSEIQSLMRISYAVFCLKKKTKKHIKPQ